MLMALFVLTLILNVILKLPFISIPLDRDYGLYGYQGLFWLRRKKTPYVDVQENHPPGRWLLYALLLKYFKPSRHLFRISNIIFLLLTQTVVFFIAKQLFGNSVALVSSLSFGILSSMPVFFWVQSNDEIQQILFTAFAIFGIIFFPVGSYYLYYLIGLSTFAALFFKQSAYVSTFPAVGIILLLQKTPVINIGLVFLGIASGFIFTWIFFRLNKIPFYNYKFVFALDVGSFKAHLDNIFFLKKIITSGKQENKLQSSENNAEYVRNDQRENNSCQLEKSTLSAKEKYRFWLIHPWVRTLMKNFCIQTSLFLFFALAGAFIVQWNSTYLTGYFSICLWLGMGVVTILLNQHLMPYHCILLLPSLSILSGFGMINGMAWLNRNVGLWCGISALIVICLVFLFCMKNKVKSWLALKKGEYGKIYTHGNDWLLNSVGEMVGKYLNSITKDSDQIYVWGTEYEIYLWAERPAPTNFLFCPRPEVSFSTDPFGEESRIVWQLEQNLPKYIIISVYTEGFRKFESLLHQHYFLERKVFGEIDIYRRIVDPVSKNNISTIEAVEIEEDKRNTYRKNKMVSIVILTFNALEYTKMCVTSIKNHTTYPHEIIFVDNSSTDGTIEYLRKLVEQNPEYKLIRNHENKGFAVGNNLGVAAATGEYVMLLNNDVLVSEGWLESMVKALEKDDRIGMVGPITNYISGRQAIKDTPYKDENGFYSFAKTVRGHNQNKVTPRRRIAGFAILMRKSLYEEASGLDESFGIGNFEDDDLCLKIFRKGFAIMVDESTLIHHFGSQTFKTNKIDYNQNIKERLKIFNKKWPDVDYEELLELNESLVDVNTSLLSHGKQALDSGNAKEAINIFSKILRTNPIDASALSGLCFAYLMRGNMDQAMNKFTRMMEITPTPNTKDTRIKLCNTAEDLSQKGKYHEAIDVYKKAIEISPDFFETHYNLAIVYSSINQIDNAIAHLKKALNLNDSDASVHNNLGVLYFKKNMYNDAKRCFERALLIDAHYKEAQQNIGKVSNLLKKEYHC